MVFAIEPVLYWPELDFAIFAEDIVLVTEAGHENLSPGMPYTVDEIEALMAEPSLLDREERE
jgi:Xaa-Pro aminopeptidase